jgi:hypothetical protein
VSQPTLDDLIKAESPMNMPWRDELLIEQSMYRKKDSEKYDIVRLENGEERVITRNIPQAAVPKSRSHSRQQSIDSPCIRPQT